jgi:F-box and WD-40 domain protein CDC4
MEPIITRRSGEGVPAVTQTIPGNGAVLYLTVTEQYIILTLDNGKIYVFNSDGTHHKTLHEEDAKAAWITAIRKDTLVSGESDGNIRVWNIVTG